MAVFFTSDTHLGHRLMARLRGFTPGVRSNGDVTPEQVAAHDDHLVATWNTLVAAGDTVWHLGDVTLKSPTTIAPVIARLHGQIHLILGNHDRAHPAFGAKAARAHQATLAAGFASVATAATVTIAGRHVALSHFPYRGDHTDEDRFAPWRPRDAGFVLLHGHTHAEDATDAAEPRQIHVGWDTWHRPVRADELAALLPDNTDRWRESRPRLGQLRFA